VHLSTGWSVVVDVVNFTHKWTVYNTAMEIGILGEHDLRVLLKYTPQQDDMKKQTKSNGSNFWWKKCPKVIST
jgi:hypothetical protein